MNHLTSHEIQEYVDGTVSNETEFHLRTCSACQSKVNAFRNLERTLHSLPLERAPSRFTDRVMQRLTIKTSPSFAWTIFRNLAPLLGLTIVVGLVYSALMVAGVIQQTELQQATSATQNIYDQIGGRLNSGVQVFNAWMMKYFSFAFAKNSYGLTTFILVFFGVIALLDKYVLMPMMKRKVM